MTIALSLPAVAPEFKNSAGRLLCLLRMLASHESHYDKIVQLYGMKANVSTETKSRAYLEYMALVGCAFDEFIIDIETSTAIPDGTRNIIKEGLSELVNCAYPVSPNSAPRKLQDAEVALLRMAASMLSEEEPLEEDDVQAIRESIDGLQRLLEGSDLKPSARAAILELMRLSRNAIDFYAIHGAKGFKAAFKKMLADLMEIYFREGTEATQEPWWKQCVDHLLKIDTVLSKLYKHAPLLNGVKKILFLEDSTPTDAM